MLPMALPTTHDNMVTAAQTPDASTEVATTTEQTGQTVA